jgi:predicted Zn-dependent protease
VGVRRGEVGTLGQTVMGETVSVLNGKMAAVNSPDVFAGTMHSVFRFCEARSTLEGRVEMIAEDVGFSQYVRERPSSHALG